MCLNQSAKAICISKPYQPESVLWKMSHSQSSGRFLPFIIINLLISWDVGGPCSKTEMNDRMIGIYIFLLCTVPLCALLSCCLCCQLSRDRAGGNHHGYVEIRRNLTPEQRVLEQQRYMEERAKPKNQPSENDIE